MYFKATFCATAVIGADNMCPGATAEDIVRTKQMFGTVEVDTKSNSAGCLFKDIESAACIAPLAEEAFKSSCVRRLYPESYRESRANL